MNYRTSFPLHKTQWIKTKSVGEIGDDKKIIKVKRNPKKNKLKIKTITKQRAKYEKGELVTPWKRTVEKKVSYPGTTKEEKKKVITYSGMTREEFAKKTEETKKKVDQAYSIFRSSLPLHTTEGLE